MDKPVKLNRDKPDIRVGQVYSWADDDTRPEWAVVAEPVGDNVDMTVDGRGKTISVQDYIFLRGYLIRDVPAQAGPAKDVKTRTEPARVKVQVGQTWRVGDTNCVYRVAGFYDRNIAKLIMNNGSGYTGFMSLDEDGCPRYSKDWELMSDIPAEKHPFVEAFEQAKPIPTPPRCAPGCTPAAPCMGAVCPGLKEQFMWNGLHRPMQGVAYIERMKAEWGKDDLPGVDPGRWSESDHWRAKRARLAADATRGPVTATWMRAVIR